MRSYIIWDRLKLASRHFKASLVTQWGCTPPAPPQTQCLTCRVFLGLWIREVEIYIYSFELCLVYSMDGINVSYVQNRILPVLV